MTTVAEMLLEIAGCLTGAGYGTATDGSTTTLEDTRHEEPDDYWNGGTLFFLTGPLAGKTVVITTWDEPTGTFTFPAQTSAVVAGNEYAVVDARYPRQALVGALNNALRELGPFDTKNEALAVIEDQWEYDLPAGVQGLKRLQFSLETVAPFKNWSPPDRWWDERGGKLYLSRHHPWEPGTQMRIWHELPHVRVSADADVITQDVHTRRIAWLAAWYAARTRLGHSETADSETKRLAEEAKQMAFTLEQAHPIHRRQRDERWIELP